MIMSTNVQDQVQSLLKSIQNVLAKLPTRKFLIWVRQQWESNVLTIWLGMFGPPCTAAKAVPAIGLRRLYRLDLLVLEADTWNEAAADAAPALFLTSLCLVVETLPGWIPSPRRQFSFGMFASGFGAVSEWNHSATWRNCPAPDHVCLMNPVQGGLQIPSSLSRACRNGLTSHLGIPSHPCLWFASWFSECQVEMSATNEKVPLVLFVCCSSYCHCRHWHLLLIHRLLMEESAEHRTSFGLLEWLLTLLVERSQEGVSFIFPSLQSRQVFILTLARLPKLASLCNLVVISPAALESLVDLVRPGFVIWNIKTRISVRTQNTNDQQEVSNLML